MHLTHSVRIARTVHSILEALAILAASALGLALYFAPTGVAAAREHRNTPGIFVTNFLLGWTVVGWVGVLIWALKKPSRYP